VYDQVNDRDGFVPAIDIGNPQVQQEAS
jgi:hypothetical protein